jgi:hypothetical protein
MSIDTQRLPDLIVSTKALLRKQIPSYAEVFAEVSECMNQEVEAVQEQRARGHSVIPEIDYASIISGRVNETQLQLVKRRGAVVVRGVFSHQQATAWNDELAEYIISNGYYETEIDPDMDRYFSTLKSGRPQIFGIYWSRPQIMARQAESMASTRTFLNRLWVSEASSTSYFDPQRECTYADRIRRREPGDVSLGLSPHTDAGSVERWLDVAYRRVYRHVFSENWREYDPFDGAHRTEVEEIPSPAVCSMFRTYQGWTALTPQGPGDGTLQLLPIAKAMVYILLRPLLEDVPEESLCGVKPARALSISPEWHGPLVPALTPIPLVEPGDTVWWHPDVVHAVQDRHQGQGYSNVMYIGAAPYCAKNAAYLERQGQAFLKGESAPDFAPENYEATYKGRATIEDLTDLGKRQMGFMSW